MRVGLVILPTDRWVEARHQWQWADGAGFCSAWTYDHVRWGGMPDGPWHAAVPVLAAAATVTTRVRLGTLVATPNVRHPVTLAREALALDDISRGRLDLGLGPGSAGFDARVLGHEPWTDAERMARFDDFVRILAPIVRGGPADRLSLQTDHYGAHEAPSTPGALQDPLPLTIAAGGRVGLGIAVRHAQHWVTIGPTGPAERTPDSILAAVRRQCAALDDACLGAGRDPSGLGKVLLWTPTEPLIDSVDQFDELVAPYEELGFDQFVLHHPAQTGPYAGDTKTFERIAARRAD